MNTKYNILYLSAVKSTDIDLYIKMLQKVYRFLFWLNIEYPGFHSWFQNKLIPDLDRKQKEIIVITFGEYIAGVSVIKNDSFEKKICTVKVGKHFRGQGLGKELMTLSLMELNADKPMITVSSQRYPQFKELFNYFGFNKDDELFDYYRNKNAEFCFNGQLEGTKYRSEIEPLSKLLYVSDHTVNYNCDIFRDYRTKELI